MRMVAAVHVGSNAIRMVVGEVDDKKCDRKGRGKSDVRKVGVGEASFPVLRCVWCATRDSGLSDGR